MRSSARVVAGSKLGRMSLEARKVMRTDLMLSAEQSAFFLHTYGLRRESEYSKTVNVDGMTVVRFMTHLGHKIDKHTFMSPLVSELA